MPFWLFVRAKSTILVVFARKLDHFGLFPMGEYLGDQPIWLGLLYAHCP